MVAQADRNDVAADQGATTQALWAATTRQTRPARAAERVRFMLADDGHGLVHGRFTLPTTQGAMLRKLVMAKWQPLATTSDTKTTADEARRLACEAGIIPLVLGPNSLLDIGRQDRLFTKVQRIAIARRDRTCTAEHCDYPPGLCHYHHDIRWVDGGRTSVDGGRLVSETPPDAARRSPPGVTGRGRAAGAQADLIRRHR